MLIKEKIHQAADLLREFGCDCWLTFVRETAVNGDPVLPFLVPGDLTWHSAFLVGRDGRTRAIVGRYDRQMVVDTGAYDDVTSYVTGFREPLQAVLKELNPRTIAVNFSEGSEICDGLTHGMYLTLEKTLEEIGMADRLVSAEKLVSALRERKSAAEISRIREAIRTPRRSTPWSPPSSLPKDRERYRRFHVCRDRPARAADGLESGNLSGRLHRSRHGPSSLQPDRPDRPARASSQHGFRGQGRSLLLGHAADVLCP